MKVKIENVLSTVKLQRDKGLRTIRK